MKVCLHKLFIQVYFIEGGRVGDIEVIETCYVLVATEMAQESNVSMFHVLDFTKSTLREDPLVKYVGHSLDRDTLA